jgi:hypothetical protein
VARSTFTYEDELADEARALGVNVSSAARDGVIAAVRCARADRDRQAYLQYPEPDVDWGQSEAWVDEGQRL